MEIKKYFKELNENEIISEDYCIVKLSYNDLFMIKELLKAGNWKLDQFKNRANSIYKAIEKEWEKAETEWY